MDTTEKRKKHRAPHSGPKQLKKKSSDVSKQTSNSKGFSIQHTTKAARRVRKTLDNETKKYHLLKNVAVQEMSPPVIVGIVGPPRSGKSTLLRALIKHFGRQMIPAVTGPITVVVGKKFRMTFIECDCNINSMIDISKIADLVLLTVNLRRGLEMYHFEFINMMQAHGMPRVIPILNHLDQFKESSASRAVRKKVKQRLWTDLSAKIFMLSRFVMKKMHNSRQHSTEEKSIEGDYLPAEIQRLARLIVVRTPRPTDWRTCHPYLLIDRLEDITNPKILLSDNKASRSLSLYGWVRGAPIEASFAKPVVHIAGLGDYTIAECSRQPDPCPTPAQIMEGSSSTEEAIEAKLKRRLSEGERRIYAPMSSIGGVLFDRDATYIDLGGSHHLGGGRLSSGRQKLQGAKEAELLEARMLLNQDGAGLDERLDKEHEIRMTLDAPFVSNSEYSEQKTTDENSLFLASPDLSLTSSDDSLDDSNEEDVNNVRIFAEEGFPKSGNVENSDVEMKSRSDAFSSSISTSHLELKEAFDNLDWNDAPTTRVNWKQLIYDQPSEGSEPAPESLVAGGMFRIAKPVQTTTAADDVTLPKLLLCEEPTIDWEQPSNHKLLADLFTTGEWKASEDAEHLLQADTATLDKLKRSKAAHLAKASGSRIKYRPEVEATAEKSHSPSDIEMDSKAEEEAYLSDTSGESDDGDRGDKKSDKEEEDDPTAGFEKSLLRPTKRQKILEKRKRHKELFDRLYEAAQRGTSTGDEPATAFYDKTMDKLERQKNLNREIREKLPPDVRETIEGSPPGSYVRLEIQNVPHQFVDNFDARHPLVVGGLAKGEEAISYVHARFQSHRWLKRVLKSNDPITVSVGWRRYQTIGVYSKEEHNLRKRYLKYALAHEHCHITFFGPVVPAKTGIIAFVNSAWRDQTDPSNAPKFRIAGTGTVTDCNESFQIMKKLKLVGHPFKIFSKTAFIRGMFNTDLEVSKMLGSKIQTVSKVRGLIKSALTNHSSFKAGDFRATFEAPIRMADIVFVRTFVPVEVPRFFNPILNLLMPQTGPGEGRQWRMLRTFGELRFQAGIKPEVRTDSQYQPINRTPFVPTPLKIPTKLVAALPYADKPKLSKKQLRHFRRNNDDVRKSRMLGVPAPIQLSSIYGDNVPDPVGHSRDRASLIQHLRELHTAFTDREKEKMIARVKEYKSKQEAETEKLLARRKQTRKEFFVRHGSCANSAATKS